MKISYAITVCNESRELYSLIAFLLKVKDEVDEINVLVDSAHVSTQVRNVVNFFNEKIVVNYRDFDGNFSEHRNHHNSLCTGDYIFMIDADEMPQETLIKKIKEVIETSKAHTVAVPRINLQPGFTQEWLDKCNFTINELGWINWPDYSIRVFKNDLSIHYTNSLHEVIKSSGPGVAIQAQPSMALWHIKSVEKQDNRWGDDHQYVSPGNNNLYDSLM